MPKLKTNKGAKKRLRVTKNGLLKRSRPGKRHLLTGKSSQRKRSLGKAVILLGAEADNLKKLLPYG
jgi:large subunit ribosomal protein L35